MTLFAESDFKGLFKYKAVAVARIVCVEIDTAIEEVSYFAADGESKSCALLEVIELLETLEDDLSFFFGNACSGVCYSNLQHGIALRTVLVDQLCCDDNFS